MDAAARRKAVIAVPALTVAAAIDAGIVRDLGLRYDAKPVKVAGRTLSDSHSLGDTLNVPEALIHSSNTVTARIADKLGGDALRDTVNFMGVLIGVNVVALVLYLMFAPFAPLIFWSVNGFLLGREYFTLAAIRRVGRTEAKRLRGKHGLTIWAAGVLMAIPLSVPLLNLVIPILGAATFTHLFHQLASVPRGATAPHPPR